MNYNHSQIEQKWQKFWKDKKVFSAHIDPKRPKYYVLDMFPYPSGAGLHVGHPLGYIASDIYCRYKRLIGFNVLHPMGYDAFGLPAEQYAIQTGQHPEITTNQNVIRYREQLDKIGLGFDWDREVKTCDPDYFHWTQEVFIKLFHHYYDKKKNKACPIEDLVKEFEKKGNEGVFTAAEWNNYSEQEKQQVLLNHRLVYLANTMVNWCPKLGTVLANDEVKDGFSERGGHPVVQKEMRQWSLRITSYAQRLLNGLEKIDWPDALKEMQRNWIGRSEGAEILFKVKDSDVNFEVFTTRPDTLFGVTFMVMAPESPLLEKITTSAQKEKVQEYITLTQKRSERDRMADTKTVSGEFTGAYCIHPFSGKSIPIWVSDYVLIGYGTGAIMAVPAHDSRDYAFAKKFNIPITQVVSGGDISESSYDAKEGSLMNSDFLNGLDVKQAIPRALAEVEKLKIGIKKINYKLRDAIFSRQRYWGEPFPIYYKNDIPYTLPLNELPLKLPIVDQYLPTEDGQAPLARAKNWQTKEGYPLETNTMPGFAGSCAYYLRYMDAKNNKELVSKEANEYWRNVDFYVGGSEHATGHLLYSRFWNMFLFDLGLVCEEEPFKKLFNQGMIQGRSNFVYRIPESNKFVSHGLKDQYKTTPIHVDVNIVKNDILDIEAFKNWREEFKNAEFILEDGKYSCGFAVEKMSKSFYNVVNPDNLIKEYGADTFRVYEMFLGPIEKSKPWNTNGIEGVQRFLNKVWALFFNIQSDKNIVNQDIPSEEEQKIIHKTIKKVRDDMEILSFNTSISALMICVNELGKLNCNKKEILEKLTLLLAPFAPHLAEELWTQGLGNPEGLHLQSFPSHDEKYLVENTYKMPISFNGKMRFVMDIAVGLNAKEIEDLVMANEKTEKWLEGKTIVKKIIVPERIFNIVIK